jgi:hypothetical protein
VIRGTLITLLNPAFRPTYRFSSGVFDAKSLFIFAEVPETFRMPMLAHEVMCLHEVPRGEQYADTCLSATLRGIAIVSEEDRVQYASTRIEFYGRLTEHCCSSAKPDDPSNDRLLMKLRGSKALLEAHYSL